MIILILQPARVNRIEDAILPDALAGRDSLPIVRKPAEPSGPRH